MGTRLIALERFSYPYGTRNLKADDEFEAVSDADAKLLVLAKQARYADEKPKPGKYKRRDMTAERTQ